MTTASTPEAVAELVSLVGQLQRRITELENRSNPPRGRFAEQAPGQLLLLAGKVAVDVDVLRRALTRLRRQQAKEAAANAHEQAKLAREVADELAAVIGEAKP